ncbi:MAG: glutaredoxin 3 [Gammaproteobacteria bacterium]|nr:glutaredoxin 3 [Gammaproteobacteria bacterium]
MSDAPLVTVYGTTTCSYCGAARMLLTRKAVRFEDVVIQDGSERFEEMQKRSGSRTVPQIFIGNTHVGGFDELCSLDKSGELDKLLAG